MLKKCLSEIGFASKRNSGMLWLMLIILVLCLVSGKLSISYLQSMRVLEENFQATYTKTEFYRISDKFIDEYENYDSPENYALLCDWNKLLHASGVLTFIEISTQYFTWQQGSAKSVCQGLYVGSNYFTEFPTTVTEGRLFAPEDFSYETGDKLPVLLGANYRDDYYLGETFWAETPFLYTEAYIIGFLPENTVLYRDGALINIDSYVVAPMIDFLNVPAEEQPATLVYMKNLGLVKTGMTRNETQDYIYSISRRLGMPAVFYILGATNQQTGALGASMSDIVKISSIMLILFLLLVIALMSFHVILKLRRNWNYYSVLYLMGFSSLEVFAIMTGDLFLLMAAANILTELIYYLWSKITESQAVSSWYNLAASVMILVIPLITAWRGFHKKDLCSRLNEGESL